MKSNFFLKLRLKYILVVVAIISLFFSFKTQSVYAENHQPSCNEKYSELVYPMKESTSIPIFIAQQCGKEKRSYSEDELTRCFDIVNSNTFQEYAGEQVPNDKLLYLDRKIASLKPYCTERETEDAFPQFVYEFKNIISHKIFSNPPDISPPTSDLISFIPRQTPTDCTALSPPLNYADTQTACNAVKEVCYDHISTTEKSQKIIGCCAQKTSCEKLRITYRSKQFDLDSFQDSLNESTAGAIGGYCAVGGVIFNGNPPGDFSDETDGPSALKNLMSGLAEKFNAFAGKTMTPMKMAKDAMQPTKFCPISGFSYFYEEGTVTPIDTQTIVDTQKTFIQNNTELNLLDEINQKTDVSSIVSGRSSEERIILAVDLLMSTKNMDIDQKGVVLEKIRTTLGTISCQCQDPSQFLGNAQNSESNVAGASAQRGEVLGTTGPNSHLLGQCAIGAKFFAEDRIACTAKEYCGALKKYNEEEYVKCYNCLYEDKGTWTALGCVYSDFSKTITEVIFPVAIGFAGLISLGCIIFAAFTMQTSAGDPEKVKKAQELITSCIAGLIVIIFSVFILRVIGVDILRIPEFGG